MSDTNLMPLPYKTATRRSAQLTFGSIKCTPDASDGDIADELNMSFGEYPVLSARPLYAHKLLSYPGTRTPMIFSDEHELFGFNGSNFFYGFDADGVPHIVSGTMRADAEERHVAVMYKTIVVYPDKVAYNTETGEIYSLDASLPAGAVGTPDMGAHFISFSFGGVQADLSAFRAGDVVKLTVAAQVTVPSSGQVETVTKTYDVCLKAVAGGIVSFEGIDAGGVVYSDWPFGSMTDFTVTGMVREAPVLETCCSVGNRVFGTVGNKIYACRLGDVTNWSAFSGISTDSWYLDTGNPEPFTASAVVGSRPVFFTETRAVVLYGASPAAYSTSEVLTHGVRDGAQGSVVVSDGYLYYLSLFGLCRFSVSGGATVISDDLCQDFTGCIAATDGRSILFSCVSAGGWRHNYRYDLKRGIFAREDDRPYTSLCRLRGALWGIEDIGNSVEYELWRISGDGVVPDGFDMEDYMDVQVDFAPFREDSSANVALRRKSADKLIIRYDAYMAPLYVSAQFKADGSQTVIWSVEQSMGAGVAVIPLPRNRSDGIRVSISSVLVPGAHFRILGMVREFSYYQGGA